MKTIEISSASRPLSEYACEASQETIVVMSDDKPIAALVSLKDADRESLALSTNPEFLEIINSSRREFQSGKTISLEEMKEKLVRRQGGEDQADKHKTGRTRMATTGS